MVFYGLKNGFATFYYFRGVEKRGQIFVWILKSPSINFFQETVIF